MRILLIEDEPELAAATAARLTGEGFVVDHLATLGEAIEAVMTTPYRAVLLDRRLPDGDGLSLLPVLRTRPAPPPVIILTALDDVPERVAGLDAGAEDYLVKPFAFEELLARLRVLFRRGSASASQAPRIVVGRLVYDAAAREASVAGTPLVLPRRELAILDVLVRRAGRVVMREQLESQVYGFDDDIQSNALEAQISRLRKRRQRARGQFPPRRGLPAGVRGAILLIRVKRREGARARPLRARAHNFPLPLRFRCGGRVVRRPRLLRPFRRLLAARGDFQPFDFLDLRHEDRLGRVLGELRADRVRLRGDERDALAANEVCPLDAFQERARLVGRGLPAERVGLQLADVVERLADRLRHVVRAENVDRCLDHGLVVLPDTIFDQPALFLRQRRDLFDLRAHGAQLLDDHFGGEFDGFRYGVTHDIALLMRAVRPEGTSRLVDKCEAATGWKSRPRAGTSG
ncbi:MAG TPA: response regulator transcription factor [Thermoanaerobaculia bacterium]|nr:response regulator transcription factor [Thermoanaerobaculia bacterium]